MIDQQPFGSAEGKPVSLYSLTNRGGLCARITDYGGIVTELHVPDRAGRLADVVLGFADLDSYLAGHPFFGALVGRVANRIAGARFELDGQTVELSANRPPNHMHGGFQGFDKKVWEAEAMATRQGPALRLRYVAADGEEGYPGRFDVTAVYTLRDDDALQLDIVATTDKPTIANVVNHTYWNLGDGPTVLDHEVQLFASRYTPAAADLVPTGQVAAVAGTAFDFRTAKPIGRDLAAAGGDPVGFDANFVVDGDPRGLRPVARLAHPASGRVLEISADQPGVQFYTGNSLHGGRGKGREHVQYAGCCFETQCFPDSINKPAWRDAVILRPDQSYRHTQIAKFGIV
ncbi:MAG TPA: aldose epimerase family protein [Geminicoccaceae bacterium]|nr:aldose epimerase family protein [Geminicoccaceae bacterium]